MSYQGDILAVTQAQARRYGRETFAPRVVAHRSFLERHNHEATQLRKFICAMLDSEESACGDSRILLNSRNKFRRFFDTPQTLPDPTHNGYKYLADEEWTDKYEQTLRLFYHHVAEKHDGELIEISRELLADESEHPTFVGENGWEDYVPEVHSPQFFADGDLSPDVHGRAVNFFKNKWWRDDAASGAREARDQFIAEMWGYPNAVWRPSGGETSQTCQITFHSLDSLVWEVVQSPMLGEDVTFADLYLFYCRCPILARTRTHSTAGGYGKGKGKKKK